MSNEGSAYSNSPHRSLLQSSNSSTIFDETEQTKQTFRPWKPLTLRTPLLLSVSVVTISLIILLELLARLSQRNGGIVFADEKFSSLADFTYLYLPVMISVSYSMLWAWIDLDAKRLEPYFQMSKPGGAKGRDSLFLHYPFDFVAFAPIKAVKRRHWAVAVAGLAMVVVFWIVTPTIGSVFATSSIRRTISPSEISFSALAPIDQQSMDLDIGFLSTAYGVLWLGQSLPNFTTSTSALRPFILSHDGHSSGSNETWTAATSEYSTSLQCEPALIAESSDKGSSASGFTFNDGKGCLTTAMDLKSFQDKADRYLAFYIGYNDDPSTDWSLPALGCENTIHSFLAIWAGSNLSPTHNISAVFCQTWYHIRDVNATVTVPDTTVTKVSPLQENSDLVDSVFNASSFEYLIAVGIGVDPPRADIPQTDMIDQSPRLSNMSLILPTDNMIGFAIGASHLPPAAYLDPTTLASSFENAHKLLFALAMRQLMSENMTIATLGGAVIESDAQAVIVVRSLAIIVECALALVAVFTVALLWISRMRQNQLREDPASLGRIMDLIPSKIMIQKSEMASPPPLPDESSVTLLAGRLANVQGFRKPTPNKDENAKGARPFEMTTKVAIAFIVLLCLSVVSIGILKDFMAKRAGLPLPSRDKVVNQVITNYVPIIFATFLEPFWVLLNRNLCVLRPFEELRNNDAAVSQSLDVKYTSLPPQLIFWRALRARHFLLVAVCGISLSANILAVSLSGLFETESVPIGIRGVFPVERLPQFIETAPKSTNGDASLYNDHFFVANSNFTAGTPLPSWVTAKAYHLPFDLRGATAGDDVKSYSAVTPAIGAAVDCTQINGSDGTMRASLDLQMQTFSNDLSHQDVINITVTDTGNRRFTCSSPSIGLRLRAGPSNSQFAGEVIANMIATSPDPSYDEVTFCSNTLLVAFLRSRIVVDSQAVSEHKNPTKISRFESVYLACRPRLVIASSEVTVDSESRVLNYTSQSMNETYPEPLFAGQQNASALFAEANNLMSSGKTITTTLNTLWHTDTVADNWFTYLIKVSTNSSDFLNASLPTPNAKNMIPVVEDLYTRLFAIVLGTNPDTFAPASSGVLTGGAINVSKERVFLAKAPYIITVTLLCMNILVAIAYYVKRPKRMLKEMPTTIASVLRLFEGSGLIADSLSNYPPRQEWRVRYGRFVGTDGKPHLGVERRPFVVPWTN